MIYTADEVRDAVVGAMEVHPSGLATLDGIATFLTKGKAMVTLTETFK